jgi:hypothetical protein
MLLLDWVRYASSIFQKVVAKTAWMGERNWFTIEAVRYVPGSPQGKRYRCPPLLPS